MVVFTYGTEPVELNC